MTGPILAAIVAAGWGLPGLTLAWWATGRNGFQILHNLQMDLKQKLERGLALLVVALMAFAGCIAVLYGWQQGAGYNSLVLAAVAMFLTGFGFTLFGLALIPEYRVNGEHLVRARQKHQVVREHGFANAVRRTLRND